MDTVREIGNIHSTVAIDISNLESRNVATYDSHMGALRPGSGSTLAGVGFALLAALAIWTEVRWAAGHQPGTPNGVPHQNATLLDSLEPPPLPPSRFAAMATAAPVCRAGCLGSVGIPQGCGGKGG